MWKKCRAVLIVCGLLFSWQPVFAGLSKADTQAIRERVSRWDEAWNAHDADAMAALFTEDADFVNVAGLHWRGRSQIRAEHAERHRTNLKNSVSVTRNVAIQDLSPQVALVHIDWGMSGDTDFDGTPRSPREGIFTWVMVRKNGVWLIRAAQNTNTTPRK